MSRTINMTPGNDNAIVWLIRLTDKDGNILRAGTQDITLDANDYDGKVMGINQKRFSLNELGKRINIVDDGTTGEVSTVIFTLARYTSNTFTNDFFNEYYPATSGKTLVGASVELGIVWNTATAESEITWLHHYNVDDYSFGTSEIQLINSEFSEFEFTPLPYYKIQKETNDGVSYFLQAPEENYGLALPIVYGDFSTYIDDHLLFKPVLFPLICVDKHSQKFIAATHKLHTSTLSTGGGTASLMYQYLYGLKTYMTLICDNGSATNEHHIAFVNHYDSFNSSDNLVYGTINIQPTIPGTQMTISDFSNIVDDDDSTTVDLSEGTSPAVEDIVALKIDGNESPGRNVFDSGSININAKVTASNGTASQILLGYYNPEYSSGAGGTIVLGHTFSGSGVYQRDITNLFNARDITDEPWSFQELLSLEYIIKPNQEASVDDPVTITVNNLWINITNIIVSDLRPKPRNVTPSRGRLRNGGGR